MAPKSVPKTCNTSKRIANWIASSEFNLERPPLARTWNKRFRGSRPSQSAAKDGAPHALIVLTKIKGWATRQEAAETGFLDEIVANDSPVELSNSLDEMQPGSWWEFEVKYLTSKGYTPGCNGKRLIP